MPYALSNISDSVILDRERRGEAEFEGSGFEFRPDSLRELGESNRLDQGGIAQLSLVYCSLQVAHWL
jgi:hypothetical protein